MEIIGDVYDINEFDGTEYEYHIQGQPPDEGHVYSVLRCPACTKTNIVQYFWHESMDSDEDVYYTILYPAEKNIPLGLPDEIKKAYNAADKVKTIDINAYVILLRRLLEMVCIDRDAHGDSLAKMLHHLAEKKEIPEKLVKVAKGLKDFGNIGAHARIGHLSEAEMPIVSSLCNAVLEYIYSAPYLATLAENKLIAITSKDKSVIK